MKKYMMIGVLLVMSVLVSGCAISADSNVDVTYPELPMETRIVDKTPYTFEIEEVIETLETPWTETQDAPADAQGPSWLYGKIQDGEVGTITRRYILTYNIKGELLSRVEDVANVAVNATKPTIYAGGQKAVPGNYYTSSRVTRYGYDCNGCNNSNNRGSTSSGIGVGDNEVRQYDGTWQEGITYEGYYIIATSQSIPLCTVVEVSNHTISGRGITPGVPFKAIVLDRGGSITDSKTDLFIGSEKDSTVTLGSRRIFDIKILDLNSRTRTDGVWNCAV